MTLFESRKHKREALRAEPPSKERTALVEKRFPYFKKLSEDDRKELLGHVNVFLAEKKFEGCGGLVLTDDIRVTIAAQACLLLLHREADYYPSCEVILVYPHDYQAKTLERAGGGMVIEREQGRLGESHVAGAVVLSWDAVRGGAVNMRDGHNVVLHEFAHQLDQEDGVADGAPILESRSAYKPWAKILGTEFDALKHDVDSGLDTSIDPYGATNPAEFFAVVTETFFEKPDELVREHPLLFDQLVGFYKQDPLERLGVHAPRTPLVEPLEPRPPRDRATEDAVIVSDMSKHAGAAALVHVGEALREQVRAIGCKHVGYIGTLHPTWAWVGEVFSSPDPATCVVLYNIGTFGEGVAFHTLLENGTRIDTEKSERAPPMTWALPLRPLRPPVEHSFNYWLPRAPDEMYAAHLAQVKIISDREGSSPVHGDQKRIFIAIRARAAERMTAANPIYVRVHRRVMLALSAIFSLAAFVAIGSRVGWLVVGQRLAPFVILAGFIGFMLSLAVLRPVAQFVCRGVVVLLPVSAKELLARGAKIDDAHGDRIAKIIRERSS